MGSIATILSHSRHYGMARSPGASQAPSYCSMYTQLPVCVPLSTNPKSWGLPDSVCPLRGIAVLLPEILRCRCMCVLLRAHSWVLFSAGSAMRPLKNPSSRI